MPRKPKPDRKTPRRFYFTAPWQCVHHPDRSDITAYVEASGTWETVATILPTSCFSAEALATFVLDTINDQVEGRDLLRDAVSALKLCNEEAQMTYTSEHMADRVIDRYNLRYGCA